MAGSAGRPLTVIEIAGVAGSGKSTVTGALAEAIGLHTVSRHRSLANAPGYLASAIQLAPTMTRVRAADLTSWRGCNKMARLRACLELIGVHTRHDCPGLAFDQGPLFLMSAIDADRRRATPSAAFSRWWEGELERTRSALAVVVMLEAPDEVLLERIRGRGKHHVLKHLHDRPARRGLATMRSGLDRLVNELTSSGTVHIERIDTSVVSVEHAVRRIVGATSVVPRTSRDPS